MGLFSFLKSRKKRREAVLKSKTEGLQSLEDVNPADIVPPETRYTQEYRDFLASQEPAERVVEESEEDFQDFERVPKVNFSDDEWDTEEQKTDDN